MTEVQILNMEQLLIEYQKLKACNHNIKIKEAAHIMGISKVYLSKILFSHYRDHKISQWRVSNSEHTARKTRPKRKTITVQVRKSFYNQFYKVCEQQQFHYVSRYLEYILPKFLAFQYQSLSEKTTDEPPKMITAFSLEQNLLKEIDRFVATGGKYQERSEFIRAAMAYALENPD